MYPANVGGFSRVRGEAGWTPNDIDADFWFDFSSPSNYALSGSRVGTLTDLTGNGYNASELGTTGPTIASADLNGLDTGNFSLASKYLLFNSFASQVTNTSQQYSFFIVIKSNTTGTITAPFGLGNSGGGFPLFTAMRFDSDNEIDMFVRNGAGGSVNPSSGYTYNNTNYALYSITFNGSSWDGRVNGGASTWTQATSPSGAVTFDRASLGNIFRSSPSTDFTGYIAEVFMKLSVVSGSDITAAETYLNDKWAIY